MCSVTRLPLSSSEKFRMISICWPTFAQVDVMSYLFSQRVFMVSGICWPPTLTDE